MSAVGAECCGGKVIHVGQWFLLSKLMDPQSYKMPAHFSDVVEDREFIATCFDSCSDVGIVLNPLRQPKPGQSKSSGGALSCLELSEGILEPAFDTGNTLYTTLVGVSVSTITVAPTAASQATVKVNGDIVTCGSQSNPISLRAGAKTVLTVEVTTQNGIQTEIYTVAVKRASVSKVYVCTLVCSLIITLAIVLAFVVPILMLDESDGPECNGSVHLCSKRVDEVVFPTAYMSHATIENKIYPAVQNMAVAKQLTGGIRGMHIAVWPCSADATAACACTQVSHIDQCDNSLTNAGVTGLCTRRTEVRGLTHCHL